MSRTQEWWHARKETLLGLAEEKSPLYVYNEEILNDTLFDLLSIEAVSRVYYPVEANPHPKILEKAYELDVCFKCRSWTEIDRLFSLFRNISPRRILFIPGPENLEAWRRAFDLGVHIVAGRFHSEKPWLELFRGHEMLLLLSVGEELLNRTSYGNNRGDREPDIPTSKIKNLTASLLKFGISPVGIHAEPGNRFEAEKYSNEILACLIKISQRLKKGAILCLGNGLGIFAGANQGSIDIQATAENLETLKDMCPLTELWVEPGHRIVSWAGVLLTKTSRVDYRNGGIHIDTDSGKQFFLSMENGSRRHDVVNLSKSDEEAAPFEKGDTLLLPNMGAQAFQPDRGADPHTRFSEHYLRARRICQVRI